MEVRKIDKSELLESEKIAAIAFEYSHDLKIDENSKFPTEYADHYCAFDENNKMMARMVVIHHKLYFDGNVVESAGIGGVASLPEYRHRKAVRKIFELVFEDMKKRNQYISHLYPFSFAYYNKFGYEAAYDKLNLKISFRLLSDIERNNRCTFIDDNKNTVLREVYEKYAAKHNGAYVRSDELWNRKLSRNIYDKRHYPYVYYNKNNEPSGHFIYTRNGDEFRIIEIGYDTKDDLIGILGFIRNFEADYKHIYTFNMPADEDFSLMFTNQYDVERSLRFTGMSRIANAKKIFELMKYPSDSGSFSISVKDEFQECNTGIYDISYNNGKAAGVVQKNFGSCDADIETSALSLVKLVFGTDDLCSYRYKFTDGIKINSNIDVLKKVFIRKHIYMGDEF